MIFKLFTMALMHACLSANNIPTDMANVDKPNIISKDQYNLLIQQLLGAPTFTFDKVKQVFDYWASNIEEFTTFYLNNQAFIGNLLHYKAEYNNSDLNTHWNLLMHNRNILLYHASANNEEKLRYAHLIHEYQIKNPTTTDDDLEAEINDFIALQSKVA